MTALTELISRWDADEGKPYKGNLIDWDAYTSGNGGFIGLDGQDCRCAQGQVLVDLGGWTAEKLHDVAQVEADKETAKLLNISRAHAVLLRNVNDEIDGAPSIVLTDPAKVLGDQWEKLLDFWHHLDGLTAEQWAAARIAAYAGDAWAAAGAAAGAAARDAARDAVAGADFGAAAGASCEIQSARIMRDRGQPFFFLPTFGFASPEDIPARPDDYGPFGAAQ